MSGPELGQVFPRGFFCPSALSSGIHLPLLAKQWGLCTLGKQEVLSQCLTAISIVWAPPPLCASLSNSVAKKRLQLHLPLSPPQEASQGGKDEALPVGTQDAHRLSAQLSPLQPLPLLPACPPPSLSGEPSGHAPLPSNVTSTSRHKTKWFHCWCC